MGLQIIALALVLVITFLHSIFGVFSGLINVFCAIIALCVAFGFFEPLTHFVTGQFTGLHPAYVEPIVLVTLFLGTVTLLRSLGDNYLRRGIRVPQAVDFAGAAVFGFITAQIYVGVLVIATLMLPIGGNVLGFTREARNPDERDPDYSSLVRFERNSLWLKSDEFTVGLFSMLSSNSFSGSTRFASVYPDFVDTVFYTTNTVQPESSPTPFRDEKFGDAFERGLTVINWWEQTEGISGRYVREQPTAKNRNPDYAAVKYDPQPGRKLIGMHLQFARGAGDRDRTRALHVFRPSQIRLVGDVNGEPRHFVPRGLANTDRRIDGQLRIVDIDNNFSINEEEPKVYAYFDVPEEFEPRFVEYRRHARAALSGEPLERQPTLELTYADTGTRDRGSQRPVQFSAFDSIKSGDSNKLPFEFTTQAIRAGQNTQLTSGRLASGRVFGSRDRTEAAFDDNAKVSSYAVPSGYRIVQIVMEPQEARTIVGDVFNFVGQLKQYYLEDNLAEIYPLAGAFAIVTRGNNEFVEVYYSGQSPDAPDAAANRSMLDFNEVERQELNQAGTKLGLIFIVKEGVEIRKLKIGPDEIDVNYRVRSGPYND